MEKVLDHAPNLAIRDRFVHCVLRELFVLCDRVLPECADDGKLCGNGSCGFAWMWVVDELLVLVHRILSKDIQIWWWIKEISKIRIDTHSTPQDLLCQKKCSKRNPAVIRSCSFRLYVISGISSNLMMYQKPKVYKVERGCLTNRMMATDETGFLSLVQVFLIFRGQMLVDSFFFSLVLYTVFLMKWQALSREIGRAHV